MFEATIVGNPIMHHLFLGLDPTELGGAPFALTLDGGFDARANELGLAIAPGAFVYALPCIAGHVGADAAGMTLAEGPYLRDELTLLVDVGTNAEIVLGNKDRLLACSSPTGPAFEGAQISCGQRAAPGAIERVRIDRATLEPRYKVIGCDLWSDEPGFAEATATSGVTGVCGSGIIEAIAEMYLAGIVSAGRRDRRRARGELAARRGGRPDVLLRAQRGRAAPRHPSDRRARNPARQGGALRGRAIARSSNSAPEPPRRITLAGAFGSHIDPLYAMTLGMIPDCDLEQVAAAGNAAGTGARIALLNRAARAEIESGRAAHREDRDRDRAALPAPFRRRDGDPQQDRRLPEPGEGGRTARAEGRRRRAEAAAAAVARRCRLIWFPGKAPARPHPNPLPQAGALRRDPFSRLREKVAAQRPDEGRRNPRTVGAEVVSEPRAAQPSLQRDA